MNQIEITPEIVKLAQKRSRLTGVDLRLEVCRAVVQEAILNLDPELNLLIDEEAAYSNDDNLVTAFEVNDLVINQLRFDIRLQSEEGFITLPRHLLAQRYMSSGSLVVSFESSNKAKVVAYVPCADWHLQDQHIAREENLILRVHRNNNFDLSSSLSKLIAEYKVVNYPLLPIPDILELQKLISGFNDMSISERRTLVDAVLANLSNANLGKELANILRSYAKPALKKTLIYASKWNQTQEKLASLIQTKFNKLSTEEIKIIIAKTGEKMGGQAESPQFRKELLSRITQNELAKKLQGENLQKAGLLAEQVIAGRSVAEALKELVKSHTTLDLAMKIKGQRQKLNNFIDATGEEISAAFSQLSLQPAYATHSTDSDSGLEAINEALSLLDVCELAQEAKELDSQLASI